MRARLALMSASLVLAIACGKNGGLGDAGTGDDIDGAPACQGLACFQTECPGGGTTSVSGTVFAPNGTLPLYNVTVYVPDGIVGDFAAGAQCDRCGTVLSGNPLVQTTTDTQGRFLLTNMPATLSVPLVIQVGKWRRQLVVPTVEECIDTEIAMTETRLPRTQIRGGVGEGDIPLMALTTGSADSLECLLRKIGIDDTEFGIAGSSARVHLYTGGVGGNRGTSKFTPTLGGADFTVANTMWGTAADTQADITARLDDYDVVLLSCEGNQNVADKPAVALAAMKDYADLGGRVFASHWHNYWFSDAAPDPWGAPILNFNFGLGDPPNPTTAMINTGFDKGQALSDWLAFVEPGSTPGQLPVTESRNTLVSIDETQMDRWISLPTPTSVQYASFLTPLEAEPDERCGRAVFSDIHVSSGDNSAFGVEFPTGGCVTSVTTLTPQEKVLAFMIFDIASCVGPVVE